jgi:hypothetical protein
MERSDTAAHGYRLTPETRQALQVVEENRNVNEDVEVAV